MLQKAYEIVKPNAGTFNKRKTADLSRKRQEAADLIFVYENVKKAQIAATVTASYQAYGMLGFREDLQMLLKRCRRYARDKDKTTGIFLIEVDAGNIHAHGALRIESGDIIKLKDIIYKAHDRLIMSNNT